MRKVKMAIWLVVAAITAGAQTGMASADSFEPDNDYSHAASITTDGQAQSHSIEPAGDEDWLIFTIEALSDVVIETNGVSGDTAMWLYNEQIVELSYDDDNGVGSFSKIQTSLSTGTYYVRIKEYNDKAIISEYFVSVLATPIEILSINPNSATQGNSIEVTITGLGTTFFQGSSTITDVWFSKGSTTIHANSFTGINATTLEASFNIPVNALAGKWNVNVIDSEDDELPSFTDGFMVYAYPDLDGDGKVNVVDFALLASHWLEVTVPSVIGMTQSEAEASIVAASLVVGTITEDYNSTIPSGRVISSSPVAGSKVNGGSAVNLLISMGPNMVWVYIDDPGVSGHEGFTGEMGKYETTNAQYCQFLNAALASGDINVSDMVYGANGSNSGEDFVGQKYYDFTGPGHTNNGATNGGAARINYSGGVFSVDSGFENHPVTYVSWYGATAFCNYYGYRLPTKWEWQAVADYDGSYNYGCGENITTSIANYWDSSHPYGTTVVGAFGTYGYGMCDMAGNVMEWTSSIVDCRYCGGCWWGYSIYCEVSYSYPTVPSDFNFILGFRVCR
jgi:sulfatase modifying factor 1